MPLNADLLKKIEIHQPPLTSVFFLIDTSGKMNGELIDAVNLAMREAIPEVQKYVQENAENVAICFNVLEFDTEARWMYNIPVPVGDFIWSDLNGSGLRSLGEAYRKLNEKLSRKNGGFLLGHAHNAPIIILLLAGTPTDDVESGLAVLRENAWFQYSSKIAIEFQVGEESNYHSALVDFIGEDGLITDLCNLNQYLKEAIMGCFIPHRMKDNVSNIDRDNFLDDDLFDDI